MVYSRSTRLQGRLNFYWERSIQSYYMNIFQYTLMTDKIGRFGHDRL